MIVGIYLICSSYYLVYSDVIVSLSFNQWGGRTALHHAANGGHLPALQLLLDRGAYIEAKARVSQSTVMDEIDTHIYKYAKIHVSIHQRRPNLTVSPYCMIFNLIQYSATILVVVRTYVCYSYANPKMYCTFSSSRIMYELLVLMMILYDSLYSFGLFIVLYSIL